MKFTERCVEIIFGVLISSPIQIHQGNDAHLPASSSDREGARGGLPNGQVSPSQGIWDLHRTASRPPQSRGTISLKMIAEHDEIKFFFRCIPILSHLTPTDSCRRTSPSEVPTISCPSPRDRGTVSVRTTISWDSWIKIEASISKKKTKFRSKVRVARDEDDRFVDAALLLLPHWQKIARPRYFATSIWNVAKQREIEKKKDNLNDGVSEMRIEVVTKTSLGCHLQVTPRKVKK